MFAGSSAIFDRSFRDANDLAGELRVAAVKQEQSESPAPPASVAHGQHSERVTEREVRMRSETFEVMREIQSTSSAQSAAQSPALADISDVGRDLAANTLANLQIPSPPKVERFLEPERSRWAQGVIASFGIKPSNDRTIAAREAFQKRKQKEWDEWHKRVEGVKDLAATSQRATEPRRPSHQPEVVPAISPSSQASMAQAGIQAVLSDVIGIPRRSPPPSSGPDVAPRSTPIGSHQSDSVSFLSPSSSVGDTYPALAPRQNGVIPPATPISVLGGGGIALVVRENGREPICRIWFGDVSQKPYEDPKTKESEFPVRLPMVREGEVVPSGIWIGPIVKDGNGFVGLMPVWLE